MVHDDETRAADLPDADARTSAPREKSSAPSYWGAQQPYRAGSSVPASGGLTLSRVLPVAILMMVLLLAFIIIWMLMHRSTSTNAVTTPTSTVANSPTPSTASSSTPAATTAASSASTVGSPAPPVSTTTLTSTATAQANGSEASESSPASAQEAVPALPASTTSACQEYSSDENSTTGDAGSGIFFRPTMDHSSCAYVKDIARQVRSVTADGSSSPRFELSAYSAKYHDTHPTGDGMVPISCVTDKSLTYCSSSASATEMWVKN